MMPPSRGLVSCCGDGAADHTQNRVDSRVNNQCKQSCHWSNGQRTEDDIQTGWQVFFNVRSNQTDDVTGDEARQDTVAAASQTAYDCEHRINAHAQWNHDSGCYTTQATGSCANLAQESNSQQVAGDVFVDRFNQEGSNCCVCHTGHRLAALWELQAKDGKNSQGEEQQTHSGNNCHHRS